MNPYSFQSVMDHTRRDGNELVVPKGLMPNGAEFRVPVAGKLNAGMANQWHETVRKEYERQQSEIAEASSSPASSSPAGGRQDREAGHRGDGSRPAQVAGASIEEQLEEAVRAGEEQLDRIDAELDRLSVARREVDRNLHRARCALTAYQTNDV